MRQVHDDGIECGRIDVAVDVLALVAAGIVFLIWLHRIFKTSPSEAAGGA